MKKYAVLACALLVLAGCSQKKEYDGSWMDNVVPGKQSEGPSVVDRVFFKIDSSLLTDDAQKTAERQSAWLHTYSHQNIRIEGHADERGTREYNLALGLRRAEAAKSYLMALGVEAKRIAVTSYGKEKPEAEGHDEAAWALNRRAVTVVAEEAKK